MVKYTKDELKQMLEPMVEKFFDALDEVKTEMLKCANDGAFNLNSVDGCICDLRCITTDMDLLLNKFTSNKDSYTGSEKMEALKEAIEIVKSKGGQK